MTNASGGTFVREFLIAVTSVVVGSVLTVLGQPYIQLRLEESREARLEYSIQRTSINALPSRIADQIQFIPTRYNLSHVSGREADDISVYLRASEPIQTSDLIITSTENYSVTEIDSKNIQIDLTSMRPQSELSIELVHNPENEISWEPVIGSGTISPENSAETGVDVGTIILWVVLITFFLAFWATFIYVAWRGLSFSERKLKAIEKDGTGFTEIEKNRIVRVFAIVLIYNSMIGVSSISLPFIPFAQIFYAIMTYILIVNYSYMKVALNKIAEETSEPSLSSNSPQDLED